LRTLNSITGVLFKQNKQHQALSIYQEVLSIQKQVLQQNDPEVLNAQHRIGNILFAQGKWIGA